ncbi:MAG: MBL fold metallo-hydrolase [SAR324 cluster bacterium]|nr:MBL fold metallo-hydrolase [SAR324 cluster bacterium]
MPNSHALISHYQLNEASHLFSGNMGNILIGCPPEVLKTLMQKHLPMPDTIVIPGTVVNQYSSLASLEFPFYHFLFIQQGLAQGKKFRVLAKAAMAKNLEAMLKMTLIGPSLEESLAVEKNLGIEEKLNKDFLAQVYKETQFLALKNKEGEILKITDLVEFVTFEVGDEITLYPALHDEPDFKIKRTGDDDFIVTGKKDYPVSVKTTQAFEPAYSIKAAKATAKELFSLNFSVRLLGVSEGFDPSGPANGILIHFNGKWVLWDCPAFAREHLAKVGIGFGDLDALFISHVHEDHIDVAQTLEEGKKVKLYSSPEIYHSMLVKVQAVLDCTYEEAASHYDFHPVYAREPFKLFGAKAEVFYSVHAIPALGLKLNVPSTKGESSLFISGDHLPERAIANLKEKGIFTPERLAELAELRPDIYKYNLVLVDAGGGMIHGDAQDYFSNPNLVNYMHTGKPIEGVPQKHKQVGQGHCFRIH